MRNVLCIFGCLLMLAVLSGCNGKHPAQKGDEETADVNTFPKFLVGTWTAEIEGGGGLWQFVFTSDGRISSVVDIWQEVLHANQTTDFNMPDGPSHITAGDFSVAYRSDKRELSVSTELKDIHIFLPGLLIDANSIDCFAGPISEDGNTWNAEHTSIFSFSDLPQDPNAIGVEQLVFQKVQVPNKK